jgi:hypothetical protein
MCKYEFFPVQNDLDPLLISNMEALIEEAQAIAFSSMESPEAMALEAKHHKRAVKLLRDELVHYTGARDQPAVNFAPFGTSTLERAWIGTMI